jgi:hypothetical protein
MDRTGNWKVNSTLEFDEWMESLVNELKECVHKYIAILANIGPSLSRPYSDTVKGSKYKNMKELRI